MSLADLMPLGLELSVLGLALIVFVADLLLGAEEKRGLGGFTVLGLSSILAASFFVDFSGQSFGVYESDGIGLYFKRVLLFAGIIGTLGSIDHVDSRYPARQGEHYLCLLYTSDAADE